MGAGKVMAEGALIATCIAACEIPDAWVVAAEMYTAQCDPDAMIEAAQAWFDVARELGQAVSAAEGVNNAIGGTGWEGKDYDAFTGTVAGYIRQMIVDQYFAVTVGLAVLTVAILNYVRIAIMCVMAVALMAYAIEIFSAEVSVVGDMGPSEALITAAAMYALECEQSLVGLGNTMTNVERVLAGTIGVFLAGDIGLQYAFGNHEMNEELVQATVLGLGTIATGLLAFGYQKVVKSGVGNPGGNIFLRALGISDTLYGSSVVDRADQGIDLVPHS